MSTTNHSLLGEDGPLYCRLRPLCDEIGVAPNTGRKILAAAGVEAIVLPGTTDPVLPRKEAVAAFKNGKRKPLIGAGDEPDRLRVAREKALQE